ncbi:hypothetical protein MBLNU459_g7091t1 [Dothideomycetes sp. NU459]
MNSLRGGMQVHAVPESERAFDASGKRLPWGYEFADAELGRRRDTEEKGAFGRSTRRRGFSRSKTATPARKEDAVRQENMQNEDAIFNKYKEDLRTKEPVQQQKPSANEASAMGGAAQQALSTREPTEVMLYGFGDDSQWAAIEYFERVSGGYIYEDYDRHPPHQRYDHSLSYNRAKMQRTLSQAALKKRNAYRGGQHWIKVTFDSPEAADLACHCSPHALHGYLVYAEPYRGVAPPTDAPVPYSNAGAQVDSQSLPTSFSTTTLSNGSPTSSNTLSTATVTGNDIPQSVLPRGSTLSSFDSQSSRALSRTSTTALDESTSVQQRPLRVAGAKRAVLLPADQAFLPAPARGTGFLGSLPILGLLFTSKGDVIGSQVPRLEDGSFDWKTASLYWCFFAWLDSILGTDICGLKGDD